VTSLFYPQHLAKSLLLPSGVTVFIRPIKPPDEPLLQDFIRSLDPRDARFRFFAPVRELSHAAAERLASIDYDRAMAMLAFPGEKAQQEIWGFTQLFIDADHRKGEFAIVVQSRRRGQGLGLAMMREMIRFARQHGVGVIWGDVMVDNRRMLDTCKDLGMTRVASPLGPGIVRVVLDLTVS
jgi:acetyltransferase